MVNMAIYRPFSRYGNLFDIVGSVGNCRPASTILLV